MLPVTPKIDHYEGLDGTPAVGIALRGQADCIAEGGERAVALHWSYNAITASLNGEVVGVIVWIDQNKESKRIWLQLGYVLPECRQMGIYGHLWRALVDRARNLKIPQIHSATRIDNDVMRKVAKAQGRIEYAISLRFDVDPELQRAC